MIKEFLQRRKNLVFVGDEEKAVCMKLPLRMLDQPELSLGPSISSLAEAGNSSFLESDANFCRKRKHTWDESMSTTQSSIELQLNDPLPMDWEQCLDLQSGRMYYLNRKTQMKSWARPEEEKIDLELNISTLASSDGKQAGSNTAWHERYPKKSTNSGGSMVAVACFNCHLLVMLSKSSPLCPNCKYVHSLPPAEPRKIEPVKSLETLSLLR